MTDSRATPSSDPTTRPGRRGRVARSRRAVTRTLALAVSAPAAAVGGQAVMEGVMMRGPKSWAVAVRRHDGTIAIQHREITSFASRHRWARIPVVRGVVALVDSLVIGMRALFVSSEYAIEGVEAKYAEDELDGTSAKAGKATQAGAGGAATLHTPGDERADLDDVERAASMSAATGALGVPVPIPHHEDRPDPDPDKLGTFTILIAMVAAMGFSIALFKVVPVTLVTFLPLDRDAWSFVLVEAGIKFALFCGYLSLVGLMPDMKRVFQYHSAEHKAINAFERGVPLEPEAVNGMSRIHVRCGTAFIVWLFIIGMLVFRVAQLTFLEGASRWEIIAARPLLLPIIAGLSFEILRFAGKHADNGALRVVLAPGLWFQRLTTRECSPDQCEVAIASLNAVVDHERGADVPGAAGPEDAAQDGDAYRILA